MSDFNGPDERKADRHTLLLGHNYSSGEIEGAVNDVMDERIVPSIRQ